MTDAVVLARRVIDEVRRADRLPLVRLRNLAALRDALNEELAAALEHAVYEARSVASAPAVADAYGMSPRATYSALLRFCASEGIDPVTVIPVRNRQDLADALG